MEKYRVRSGGLDVVVKARTHQMAIMKALEKNLPPSLGIIISALKEGDSIDDEIYMLTGTVLENMGLWENEDN